MAFIWTKKVLVGFKKNCLYPDILRRNLTAIMEFTGVSNAHLNIFKSMIFLLFSFDFNNRK
ncbi:hypothetical protein KUTeg_002333 [Tegillarca granosa]|uniref:Uncharacterized protein n=1 Tax=Tegillarca granosa TaxID=220873 RepID=A0ABQ9FVG2_TEGGR|nr:hypothetical protein KUTeg_002333 [Tegillarca granosa]